MSSAMRGSRASSVQLFPCSDKVQVPSPSVSSGRYPSSSTKGSRSTLLFTPASRAHGLPPQPPPQRRLRSDKSFRTSQQISELSSQLSFHKDAVLAQCPEAITYQEAKRHVHQLCRADWVPLERRSHSVRFAVDVGRHDARGMLKMHKPCLPSQPTHQIPSWQTAKRNKPLPPIKTNMVSDQHGLSKPSSNNDEPFQESVRGAWEEAVLSGMSHSAAQRYIANTKGQDKQRLSETLNRLENETEPADSVASVSAGCCIDEEAEKQPDDPDGKDSIPTAPSFLVELQQGASIVHNPTAGAKGTLLLSNKAQFEKVLQPLYPQIPQEWLSTKEEVEEPEVSQTGAIKIVRGTQRWVAFPERTQTPLDMQWTVREPVEDSIHGIQEHSSFDEVVKTKCEELLDIANDLLNKWHVRVQPQDVCEEFVLNNLLRICGNVKMHALGAVAAMFVSILKRLRTKETGFGEVNAASLLCSMVSEKVVEALSQAVRSEVQRAVVVSAVLLTALEKDREKCLEVLRDAVDHGCSVEKWAAVQCLAVDGEASPLVLKEMMAARLAVSDQQKLNRSSQLLVRLSKLTTMVQAVVTEQLNGITWQERQTACLLLSQLHGGINKDVCGRLVTMVWSDWSPAVRTAAAQALGQTGHGKLVHDEIEKRLKHPDDNMRLEALKQVRSLKLMTSQMKPVFLQCFNDEHTSVKLEAIQVAEELKLVDTDVVLAIQDLLQDPFWKVKAHAIRALGGIGLLTEELLKDLLWIVRFERLPALRAEGCLALATLGVRTKNVEETLRDLIAVDDDPLVLSEARKALLSLGYGSEVTDAMAEAVCLEVRRLGNQDAITEQVLGHQHKEMVSYVLQRPVNPLSARDYLTDKTRQKVFCSKHKATNFTQNHTKSWAPDKTTIDKHLNTARRKSLAINQSQLCADVS